MIMIMIMMIVVMMITLNYLDWCVSNVSFRKSRIKQNYENKK